MPNYSRTDSCWLSDFGGAPRRGAGLPFRYTSARLTCYYRKSQFKAPPFPRKLKFGPEKMESEQGQVGTGLGDSDRMGGRIRGRGARRRLQARSTVFLGHLRWWFVEKEIKVAPLAGDGVRGVGARRFPGLPPKDVGYGIYGGRWLESTPPESSCTSTPSLVRTAFSYRGI